MDLTVCPPKFTKQAANRLPRMPRQHVLAAGQSTLWTSEALRQASTPHTHLNINMPLYHLKLFPTVCHYAYLAVISCTASNIMSCGMFKHIFVLYVVVPLLFNFKKRASQHKLFFQLEQLVCFYSAENRAKWLKSFSRTTAAKMLVNVFLWHQEKNNNNKKKNCQILIRIQINSQISLKTVTSVLWTKSYEQVW